MAKKKVTPEQVEAAERQLKELQRQVEYDTKDYTLELLLDKFEKGDFYIPDICVAKQIFVTYYGVD